MNKQVKNGNKLIGIGFMGKEYQIQEKKESISIDLIIIEDKIKAALEQVKDKLNYEFEVGITYEKDTHKFVSVEIYPLSLCGLADAIDEEFELDFSMYEVFDVYAIELSMYQALYLGVSEIAEMIVNLDKAYSQSIFADYDEELFEHIDYDEQRDKFFAFTYTDTDVTCTMYDADLQREFKMITDGLRQYIFKYKPYKWEFSGGKLDMYKWEIA